MKQPYTIAKTPPRGWAILDASGAETGIYRHRENEAQAQADRMTKADAATYPHSIQKIGEVYHVFDRHGRDTGESSPAEIYAWAAADRLDYEAKATPRKCMKCGKTFIDTTLRLCPQHRTEE